MADEDLVELTSFGFVHEAELAASVLEAAGIECVLRDAFVGGVRPHLTFTSGGVILLVLESDVERAREVLSTEAVLDLDEDNLLPPADADE